MDFNEAGRGALSQKEVDLDIKAGEAVGPVGKYAPDGLVGKEHEDTILVKMQAEDYLIQLLLTSPDYSLPYFARIKDDDRLKRILRNFDTMFSPAKGDQPSALSARVIDVSQLDDPDVSFDQIRAQLGRITRDLPHDEFKKASIVRNTTRGWTSDNEG